MVEYSIESFKCPNYLT